MSATISTLQEVRDWLQTISTGASVTVSSSMFDAEMIKKLLTLAPGMDNVVMTVTEVDATGDIPFLKGTATVLEQANSTTAFRFSQPAEMLLCTQELQLDPATRWQLIQSFKLFFTQLNATFTPDEELKVIGLRFASVMQAGETNPLNVPVNFVIPSFDGDWTLTGSFDQLGNLTDEVVQALAGNNPVLSALPADVVAKINAFSLKTLQISFNPIRQTCAFIRIIFDYKANWSFFNDMFVVEDIEFDFEVFNPLSQNVYYQAVLLAKMNIFTGLPIEVGGQFPDKVVFGHLQEGKSANINQIFQFLHIPLPENFPVVEISTLGVNYYTAEGSYDFRLGITRPIPIAGSVTLNNAFFLIGAKYDPVTKKMNGYGNINAQFDVGKTTVLLGAQYDAEKGIDFMGEVDNLPIGDLIADLVTKFGIERSTIPGFVTGIKIDKLKVTYNTKSGNFSFNCKGTVPLADTKLTIELTLTAIKAGENYQKDIHAEGKVIYKDQTFTLTFDKTTSATAFAATWVNKGTPLGIMTIAEMLGIGNEMPEIPSELDLGLNAAGFVYENAAGQPAFVLSAASANYGNAVFASYKDKTTEKWTFYFGLSTDRKIDLSNLPILDKLSSVTQGTLAVEGIHVDITSDIISKENATLIDSLIKKYAPAGKTWPVVPEAGMESKVGFSMQVNIGGTKYPIALGAASTPAGIPLIGDEVTLVQPGDTLDVDAAAPKVFWFNLQKNFGPLFFDKIGLMYKAPKIYIVLNVSATAGGLTISLDGFGVSLPIKDFDISFTISGIGITFQSGPILLSGGLIGSFDPVNLVGQVLIKTSVISIGAIGGYTEVENRPSMFIFAVLNYPIGGPPYFFVTGLAAGFGYNRALLLPDIGGVAEFPFVQWAMGLNSPPAVKPNGNIGEQVNKTLQTIIDKGIVAPSVGSNWLAAGIRFTTFEILDSFALLTVAFGTEFEVALLGLSRIVLPPAANKAGSGIPVVAYAELALKASYSQRTGLIGIQGQLTANSYVLSPKCHLTGGFAFYTWVSGEHLGDFVVTLGGYNNNYPAPSHYPKVPRLGMNWQVVDQLVIKGGLYCALTSNAVMAGGYMEAVWQSGSIKAWFSLQADFLIMWKPFHYDISASVSIGASFTVDLWFTTLSMTVHVGAALHIWGPEFSGTATVDLSIISFTIKFGAGDTSKPKTIEWNDFAANMLPQKSKQNSKLIATQAGNTPVPDPDVCKLVIAAGLIKELSDKEGDLNWIVNGETFELTTNAIIPSKEWAFSGNISLDPDAPSNKAKQNNDFGIRPTGTDPNGLATTHDIKITSKESSTFHAVKTLGKVAKAMWKKIDFDKNGNPIVGDPVKDTTIKDVLTGFSIIPFVPDPSHTLPIKIEYLQFDIDPNIQYFIWGNPYVATTDSFKGETVSGSIMSDRAKANRGLLVKSMAAFNSSLNTSIDVKVLADANTDYLLSEPVMRILGEEKI